ncbi:MAG: LacI family DNA-binding transcriptional regulator [Lentisphaeria bacterium]|nr:LacI family DNA-binding transcriptional regulator [Lentisphaeria bacterium]
MIRCKDIAEMVGVSRQAVTAVLNNSRPNCVSEEKRTEILKIAAQYNYRPNHAAKVLKTGKSNIIGIVMPPWSNPYIAELCMACQRALAERNYTPFFTIDNNFNPVPGNLEQLLSLQVAGMITVSSSLLPDNIDVPVVSYFNDDPRFDSVCTDAEQNSRMIMEYLKKCGHRKIGYLGYFDRRQQYLTAEAERGDLEFPEHWRIGQPHPLNEDLFNTLLETNHGRELPTALIVHNDALALKVMRRIHDMNYRIPEDFSIIGHDNIPFCASMMPGLTTISFGTPETIADTMVELLMKRIADPARPREKILLKPEFFERETVADLNI